MGMPKVGKKAVRTRKLQKDSRGVLYIVTGAQYTQAAIHSARLVARTNPGLAIAIFTDQEIQEPGLFSHVRKIEAHESRRKHEFVHLTPFERTLYMDSDTIVTTALGDLFQLLDKYDVAAAHVRRRDSMFRLRSFKADVPRSFPQVNCGVMLYRMNERMEALFARWREIYNEGGFRRDQIPFREALWHSDARLYVLPPEYNQRDFVTLGTRLPLTRIFHLKFLNWPNWRHVLVMKIIFAYTRRKWRAYERELELAASDGLKGQFTGLKTDA